MAEKRTPARDIADDLRAAIRDGTYAGGDRLPSRAQLMQRYGVASMTVLAAIDQLRTEGLVESVTGSGVFVRAQRQVMRSARARLSRSERDAGRGAFATDAHTGGWTASSNVTVRTEQASDEIAAQLGITPGDEVLVRDRVLYADAVPVQLATSYLPAEITTEAMARPDTGPGGLYARLEEAGHHLERFQETVRIGNASPEEATTLDAAPGAAVFRVVRVASADDRVVEVNEITMLGDRFELYYDLPAQ